MRGTPRLLKVRPGRGFTFPTNGLVQVTFRTDEPSQTVYLDGVPIGTLTTFTRLRAGRDSNPRRIWQIAGQPKRYEQLHVAVRDVIAAHLESKGAGK